MAIAQQTVCGATESTSGHVCCTSQMMLPSQFTPTATEWHYTESEDMVPDNLSDVIILPWPTGANHQSSTDTIGENILVTVNSDDSDFDDTESTDAIDIQEYDSTIVVENRICPERSLCVPWTMCDPAHSLPLVNHHNLKFHCGATSDSVSYICCSRPLRLADHESTAPLTETTPLPETAPPVEPLPLQELAEVYNTFTPPPPALDEEQPSPGVDYLAALLSVVRHERDLSQHLQRGAVKLGKIQPEETVSRRNIERSTGDNMAPVQELKDEKNKGDLVRDDVPIELVSKIKPLKAKILTETSYETKERSSSTSFLDKLLAQQNEKNQKADHLTENETIVASVDDDQARGHLNLLEDPSFHHRFLDVSIPQPIGAEHDPFHRFFPSLSHGSAERPIVHHHNHHFNDIHDLLPRDCGQSQTLSVHGRITSATGGSRDGSSYHNPFKHQTLGGGGTSEAGYGQFPWHCGVLRATDLTYLCAAVLVTSRAALTVAHCLHSAATTHHGHHHRHFQSHNSHSHTPSLLLRIGDWDLASDNEFYPAYDVPIASYVIHQEYYSGSLMNDIAILHLQSSVHGVPHVQPACLPPPTSSVTKHTHYAGPTTVYGGGVTAPLPTDPHSHHHHGNPHQYREDNEWPYGEVCEVSGWGRARPLEADHSTSGASSGYSWRLLAVPLTPIASARCQHLLRHTRLGPHFRLAPRGTLCAVGAYNRQDDACVGDGGGGLVCTARATATNSHTHQSSPPEAARKFVAGLVSWGVGCGQGTPAVYTRVSDYYHWIIEQLSLAPAAAQHDSHHDNQHHHDNHPLHDDQHHHDDYQEYQHQGHSLYRQPNDNRTP